MHTKDYKIEMRKSFSQLFLILLYITNKITQFCAIVCVSVYCQSCTRNNTKYVSFNVVFYYETKKYNIWDKKVTKKFGLIFKKHYLCTINTLFHFWALNSYLERHFGMLPTIIRIVWTSTPGLSFLCNLIVPFSSIKEMCILFDLP